MTRLNAAWILCPAALLLVACTQPFRIATGGGGTRTAGQFIPGEGVKPPKRGSAEYEKFAWESIIYAQQQLARFGYGVRFTGTMDEQTTRALKEYQKRSGLPITGDLDPATNQQLTKDSLALGRPALLGHQFDLIGEVLMIEGVWVKRGTDIEHWSVDSGWITRVECSKHSGKCYDVMNDSWGLTAPDSHSGTLGVADITHWSKTRVEAEYRSGQMTARYWFDAIGKKATKARFYEAFQTEWYDLVDGSQISAQLSKKLAEAERRIMLMPAPPGVR